MLTVKEAQSNFFDRQKVIDAIGRAKAAAFAKGGALVRTISRRSMRRRKRKSPRGSAPSAHVGLLRDLLFFSFDFSSESTVVGPTTISGGGTAPNLLEFGGEKRAEERMFVPGEGAAPGRVIHQGEKLVYGGNPYMGPALLKAAPSLPSHWANSVRG